MPDKPNSGPLKGSMLEDALILLVEDREDDIFIIQKAFERAGLKNPLRPVGSFLFLGPTGVGKTEVARRLAEFLFGSERSLIRFDMSEFMERHAAARYEADLPQHAERHQRYPEPNERARHRDDYG